MGTIALEADWASLHKILSDPTRRSILELLAERDALSYTDVMTLLQITNTGRLNYHLKALGNLLSKDEGGKYRLTEQGRQAAGLLKTFPERVQPEQKLTGLKVALAVVLILLGLLIIVSFSYLLLGSFGTISAGTTAHGALSAQVIPQNTTVYLTSWAATADRFGLSWNAAGPVTIYVLNQTQNNQLLFLHSGSTQGTPVLQNFSGTPGSWVQRYDQQSGNVSVSVSQGQYYFYAWSSGRNLLDNFDMTQTQTQSGGNAFSPFLYLYASVFLAIGALLIVLATSILTRRVWR